MASTLLIHSSPLVRLGLCLATFLLAWITAASLSKQTSRGQEPDAAATPAAEAPKDVAEQPPSPPVAKSINIFELAVAGGIFMIPIAVMSILAVTMAIERALALRRSRVLPDGLVRSLGELTQWSGRYDMAKGQQVCRQFPSAAANVFRVLFSRAGSPTAELESAMTHAAQREADKLYGNVRWLNTAASLSTLLGLIGTIQGMIMAFHQLHTMDVTVDRTSLLAAGIYTALVTTFAGLAVAIPTLLASNYFETRIIKLFHEIEELGLELLPRLASQDRAAALSDDGDGAASDVASALPPKPAHLL